MKHLESEQKLVGCWDGHERNAKFLFREKKRRKTTIINGGSTRALRLLIQDEIFLLTRKSDFINKFWGKLSMPPTVRNKSERKSPIETKTVKLGLNIE